MEKINKCDNNGKKFNIKRNKKNTNNYEKLQNFDYDETELNCINNYDLIDNSKNSNEINENYLIDNNSLIIIPPLSSTSSERSSILSSISSSSAATTSSSTSFERSYFCNSSDICSESFIKNYNITENLNINKMKKSKQKNKMTYVKKLTLKFEKLAHSSDIKNNKKFQCIKNYHNINTKNNNYDNICNCMHNDTSHSSCLNENHTNILSKTTTPSTTIQSSSLSSSLSSSSVSLSNKFQNKNYYSIENQNYNKKISKNFNNINYNKLKNENIIKNGEQIEKDTFNNKNSSLKSSSSSTSSTSSSSSSSSDAYETCDMSDESEFKSKQKKQHNEEEIQDDVDQQVNNVDHLLKVKCNIEEEEEQQQQQQKHQQNNQEEEEDKILQQQKSFNIPGIFIENIGESSTDEPLTILRECDTNVEAKYRQSDPNPKINQDICETINKHAESRSISNYPLTSNDDTDEINSTSTQLSSSKLSLVYDSKEIPPIIEELIRTEETYIKNLKIGIHNYGKILNRTNKNLPKGLRGKKLIILGNIEQICEFHDIEFLPMLIKNQFNLKDLFDDFMKFIDENCFYSYVLYTMNKKRSIKLCEQYRQYFKSVQEELNDKLGINSFLVQPIQRLARYPLLLQQFIMTCFKTGNIKYKPIIESCCKVEKRVRNLLTTTNEAEEINDIEDCNDINILHQGKFKKMNEFNVYDYTQRRSYRSKVFIFDKCLLYTEIRDKRLIFRGYYPCEYIGFISKLKSFTLYYHKQKYQECEFTADKQILDLWIDLIRDMIRLFAEDEKRKLKEKYLNSNNNNTNNTNTSNNCNGYRQCDIYRRPSSILLLRNSSRLSTDSGTNISVFSNSSTSSTNSQEENSPRTTWYADTFDTL